MFHFPEPSQSIQLQHESTTKPRQPSASHTILIHHEVQHPNRPIRKHNKKINFPSNCREKLAPRVPAGCYGGQGTGALSILSSLKTNSRTPRTVASAAPTSADSACTTLAEGVTKGERDTAGERKHEREGERKRGGDRTPTSFLAVSSRGSRVHRNHLPFCVASTGKQRKRGKATETGTSEIEPAPLPTAPVPFAAIKCLRSANLVPVDLMQRQRRDARRHRRP